MTTYTKIASGAKVRIEAKMRDVTYTRPMDNDYAAPVVIEATCADVYSEAQPIDMSPTQAAEGLKPKARMLVWCGPGNRPATPPPAARTYAEFPESDAAPANPKAYWQNGGPLYDQGDMNAAVAAAYERCAVAAWNHYMDVCKARGLPANMSDEWCAAKAIRALR